MRFWTGVNPQSVSNASDGFREFKAGDNVATIIKLEEAVSKSGNPMLQITFSNEEGAEIRYFIVEGEYKLSRIKQIQTTFGIPLGSIYDHEWIGKKGIVVCKPGEPNEKGLVFNKVSYFRPLNPEQNIQSGSTPSTNKPSSSQQSSAVKQGESEYVDDGFSDDIPF